MEGTKAETAAKGRQWEEECHAILLLLPMPIKRAVLVSRKANNVRRCCGRSRCFLEGFGW